MQCAKTALIILPGFFIRRLLVFPNITANDQVAVGIFSPPGGDWLKIPIQEIEQLPAHSRELVETYCLYDDAHYFVPASGFKVMDLVNFLNHSSTPNLCSVNDGEYFEALEDIPAGAELLINYYGIVDAEGY